MLFLLIVGGLIAFLFFTVGAGYPLVYKVRALFKGFKMPPVRLAPPLGIPMVVRLIRNLKKDQLLEKWYVDMMAQPPTFMDQRLLAWNIQTRDPENVKAILSTQFKDYTLGRREPQLEAFGKGIFTLSSEPWKHSRAMLRPQFSRDKVSQLGSVTEHVSKLITAIDKLESTQEFVDIQPLFHELTIDTATEFLFGESLDCLDIYSGGNGAQVTHKGKTVTAPEFVESYMEMLNMSALRTILGILYPLGDSKNFRNHITRARIMVDHYVELALKRAESEKIDDSYVFSWELAKVVKDPVVIRDQIFNILIAGRDTTASTLSYMTFYLAHNPEIFDRLRQEVIENFGTREENRPVTFEMLRASKYLNAVINETLRLAPVVPLNFRHAVRDTVLPHGGGPNGDEPIFVPAGTEVAYSVYVMHRDPKIWGPDSEQFNPDRFLAKLNIPAWAYIPFNGGPRICLGQQFALTELALTYVRLLQRYSKLTPSPSLPEDPVNAFSLTLKYGKELQVRFA